MNDAVRQHVYDALCALGIDFDTLDHEPVLTIEDCLAPARALRAVVPKNLFLTTRNQSAHYLCLVRPEGVFRTASISKQIGASRLSFAPEDALLRMMRTLPGAISPMGLLFDTRRDVRLLADRKLLDLPRLGFHPCVNTATLAMSSADFFHVYLPALGREVSWVDVEGTDA